MRRISATAATLCLLLTAGCSSVTDEPPNPTARTSAVETRADPTRADANLILTMYGDINTAFQTNPDDGVRAMIAYQYPDDLADVDFARCVAAIDFCFNDTAPTEK